MVLGILCQKEDGRYYLEDGTYAVVISFSELENVEEDGFFTEMCVILAEGRYSDSTFFIKNLMHPPLHANKSFKFQLNDQDYFGSYTKLTENMMIKNSN